MDSVRQIAAALQSRKLSSVELTTDCLQAIRHRQGTLNAFITITDECAMTQAKAADASIAAGTAGPLTGIPIAHKDLFCTSGVRTTCASRMLQNWTSPYDATIVEKLAAAGSVMVGKTNMDEFAMGSSNENSFFGPVRNPWDLQRVSGGSSGGSAAAVSAGLVSLATCTDTGGSIRQPAALCGITGIKPTYGRVSRYGMVAFASSLDQGGAMARRAEDIALVLRAMSGFDERDSTSVKRPVEDFLSSLGDDIAGLRIGIVREHFGEALDAGVAAQLQVAISLIEQLGGRVQEISLPHAHLSIPAYYVVAPAECSSNLSRFDGVRFGHRASNPASLEEMYKRSRAEGFGAEVRRRIMIGTYVLSAGYYDAYYLRAQRVRRLISQDFAEAFKNVDVLAGPTSPTVAFKLGERTADPVTMYYSDIYTIPANLAGLPAMSIPAGFVQGLPVGLQLVGPHFSEARLLNVAHRFQQHTDFHLRIPPALA